MADNKRIIAAPLDAGKDFTICPELTIYQAAMIYAGRHPHEGFLRNGTVDDYLRFLRAGIPNEPKSRKRARAQRSWTVYCELMARIKTGTIKPVRCEYQRSGEIDPVSTMIRLADVIQLATERGERPKYLQHIQTEREVQTSDEIKPAETERPATQARRQRGPEQGTVNRYGEDDRALFPAMDQLIPQVGSAWAAALQLATGGKIRGTGSVESKAKRLLSAYKARSPQRAETR
ncbi:MAG TPA: hypothetical protein VKC66_15915 [Xanthobacteraceae bacterium]|nr:hypothetical protein [Xanthobacteraceae bacterium]